MRSRYLVKTTYCLLAVLCIEVLADEMNVQYERGEVTCSVMKEHATVLNLILDVPSEENVISLLNNIEIACSDVVCVSGDFDSEIPSIMYENLKNLYSHFYYIPSDGSDDRPKGTVVMSQYFLQGFEIASENSSMCGYTFMLTEGATDFVHIPHRNLKNGGANAIKLQRPHRMPCISKGSFALVLCKRDDDNSDKGSESMVDMKLLLAAMTKVTQKWKWGLDLSKKMRMDQLP
jgi:hypothetical protein